MYGSASACAPNSYPPWGLPVSLAVRKRPPGVVCNAMLNCRFCPQQSVKVSNRGKPSSGRGSFLAMVAHRVKGTPLLLIRANVTLIKGSRKCCSHEPITELTENVTRYLWSARRRPQKVRAYFRHPQVRYVAKSVKHFLLPLITVRLSSLVLSGPFKPLIGHRSALARWHCGGTGGVK